MGGSSAGPGGSSTGQQVALCLWGHAVGLTWWLIPGPQLTAGWWLTAWLAWLQVVSETPTSFLAGLQQAVAIDAKTLRFCYDRLSSLMKVGPQGYCSGQRYGHIGQHYGICQQRDVHLATL